MKINENLDSVVKNIESSLKTSMNFPNVGSPYGIIANGSLIALEHPEHIYVALRIHRTINTYLDLENHKKLQLVEIGGGYGGLAFWVNTDAVFPSSSKNPILNNP